MLGDTITFMVGGSGGTARTLSKINQDNFSAEYLYRSSTEEIRVQIRHSKESLKAGYTYPIERHNIVVTQTVFATATELEKYRSNSFTIRARANDDPALVTDVGEGLTNFLTSANLVKLSNWES